MEQMKNQWTPVTEEYKAQMENPANAVATDVPQFSTAEYSTAAGAGSCQLCGEAISGSYYRVNRSKLCGQCAAKVQEKQSMDSHTAFVSAVVFGVGGAAIGLALYSGFVLLTGISIGYLALAVGWIVAKAMLIGSKGVRGPRYQIVAVLLTYFAISLSSIAILLGYSFTHADAGSLPDLSISRLILLGLASPFLRLIHSPTGFIGLIILFVGLSIAFRMTKARALSFEGPFNV
jgi:uncharacterized protein (DUF983 family)